MHIYIHTLLNFQEPMHCTYTQINVVLSVMATVTLHYKGFIYVTQKNNSPNTACILTPVFACAGFDSVLAKGKREPDPSLNAQVILDGKFVSVPQGKPDPRFGTPLSNFEQSEYLVYKETQQRLRYVCRFKFSY